MTGDPADPVVRRIMDEFAERTGLSSPGPKRRYLWTDAFAVCNYLALHRRSDRAADLEMALRLVEQVHHVLGRHREDDPRTGWISGLAEVEGEQHPTIGGLRIGKPLNERGPDEPFDRRLEWERDGQYYHYLTRWMLALDRVRAATGDPVYHRWAVELARTAHARFSHSGRAPGTAAAASRSGSGIDNTEGRAPQRLHWKMSVDLSRVLVPGSGQHDPLDGLAVFTVLQASTAALSQGEDPPDLDPEILELKAMCEGTRWVTDDPLGIGGLLTSAYLLASEYGRSRTTDEAAASVVSRHLLQRLLGDAVLSVESYAAGGSSGGPAAARLPFRELGLCIGLRAMESLREMLSGTSQRVSPGDRLFRDVDTLSAHSRIADELAGFWSDTSNWRASTWSEHRDINSVMLATSLAPEGYLAT